MTSTNALEKRVEIIEKRNARVENDKAWETSMFRKLTIAVMTYFFACVFLLFTDSPHPFIGALFPPTGFILSTLSLPIIKRWWLSLHA
jgi:hypothetical protein